MGDNKKYANLHELMDNDAAAMAFYNKMPDYVQRAMQERADGIQSLKSMQSCADNMTRGDC